MKFDTTKYVLPAIEIDQMVKKILLLFLTNKMRYMLMSNASGYKFNLYLNMCYSRLSAFIFLLKTATEWFKHGHGLFEKFPF